MTDPLDAESAEDLEVQAALADALARDDDEGGADRHTGDRDSNREAANYRRN